jgi:HEAT repeat protein
MARFKRAPLLTALAMALLGAAAGHSGQLLERAEASRYALLAGPPPHRLAAVLESRYHYQVLTPGADLEAIRGAMEHLYETIQPYDHLLVHVSLPLVHREWLSFVPGDGNLDEPWTLLELRGLVDWLNRIPTGSALITYPSCRQGLGVDPVLEELAYGKRPGAVEILQICDFEALRDRRPDLDAGVAEWNPALVADAIADILEETASRDPGDVSGRFALSSPELTKKLGGRLEGFDFRLVTVPYSREPTFRFAPVATVDEYRDRYERAGSYEELSATLQDYIAFAGSDPSARTGLVDLLQAIALHPGAAAPRASLKSKQALQLRVTAVDALASMEGVEAQAALREIVESARDESIVRRTAISALSTAEGSETLETLRTAAADPDPSVREAAVRGLLRAQDEAVAPFLKELLAEEQNPRVRISLIQGLSSFQREENRAVFVRLLGSSEWVMRREAIAALSQLEPEVETNLLLLTVLTNDEEASVRQTAALALARTWREDQRDEIVAGLRRVLAGEAGEGSESLLATAASALGRIGGREAEDALRDLLRNEESPETTRIAAADGLGRLKTEAAVPELARAANAPSPAGLRRAAVKALGEIGSPEAVEIIFSRLEDEDDLVRDAAKRWVGELEAKETLLQKGLGSTSPEVRQIAVRQLGFEADDRLQDAVIARLDDEDAGVRRAAMDSLAKSSNPETLERVIRAFENGNLVTRLGVLAVLGGSASDDPRVIEVLADASRNTDVEIRTAAVEALGNRDEAGISQGEMLLRQSRPRAPESADLLRARPGPSWSAAGGSRGLRAHRRARPDRPPRLAYVLGVALHSSSPVERALEALKEAYRRHPGNGKVVAALMGFHESVR